MAKDSLRLVKIAAALVLVGVIILGVWAVQPVTIWRDGKPYRVQGFMLTVADALHRAGIILRPADRISPGLSALLGRAPVVIHSARTVWVVSGSYRKAFTTTERLSANLLQEAGLKIFPADELLLDGAPIPPDAALPVEGEHLLQLRIAQPVTLQEGAATRIIYSAAPTIDAALWQAGIRLMPGDRLSPPPGTALFGPVTVQLTRARRLEIATHAGTFIWYSAAPTVGSALAEAGAALEGLDYSIPAEDEPLPADGKIRRVDVREVVQLNETPIPYEITYQPDDTLELDQLRILDPGQTGALLTRQRIRYEDGIEVLRQAEGEYLARQPQNRVIGYGTKVVVRTTNVGGTTIEYWRAVTVYATSYSPCRSDATRCYPNTASGLPVKKGVVGVVRSWYNVMVFQRVYVPGYGAAVIADIGGGIPGQYWIDLGYSDNDYVSWNQTVTMYFLTPVPSFIPYILP